MLDVEPHSTSPTQRKDIGKKQISDSDEAAYPYAIYDFTSTDLIKAGPQKQPFRANVECRSTALLRILAHANG
jgi:hypothetical protein